jgi:hypothetical protein
LKASLQVCLASLLPTCRLPFTSPLLNHRLYSAHRGTPYKSNEVETLQKARLSLISTKCSGFF